MRRLGAALIFVGARHGVPLRRRRRVTTVHSKASRPAYLAAVTWAGGKSFLSVASTSAGLNP
jgi:hypothetical protein